MGKKLKCIDCCEIIESKFRHDYVPCKCGKIFVDGGNDYLRYGGDFDKIMFDFNGEWLSYNEVQKFESMKEKEMTIIENGKNRIQQAKNEIMDILKRYDCKLQIRNLQTLGLVTTDEVVHEIIEDTIPM